MLELVVTAYQEDKLKAVVAVGVDAALGYPTMAELMAQIQKAPLVGIVGVMELMNARGRDTHKCPSKIVLSSGSWGSLFKEFLLLLLLKDPNLSLIHI